MNEKSILFQRIRDGDTFLVTGASGFIGRNIVHLLKKTFKMRSFRLAKVFIVVRDVEKAKNILGKSEFFEYIKQDVAVEFSFKLEVDYIIHAAGICEPKTCELDPLRVMEVNSLGTRNLLAYAVGAKARSVLLISSASIYGQGISGKLRECDHGFIDYSNIANVYAVSKLNMEFWGLLFARKYSLPVKIVRPFHLYGQDCLAHNLVEKFVGAAINGDDIVLQSKGNQLRNFTHIFDAVEGMFFVMVNGVVGEIYNIGNSKATISVKELGEKVKLILGKTKIRIIINEKKTLIQSNYLDMVPATEKIELLGWTPLIDLNKGIMLLSCSSE